MSQWEDLRAECDSLIARQSEILRRTAVALRGHEHDLPERAAAVVAERDALKAEAERWRALTEVGTLHANLLRGYPARLPRHLLLHLLGDDDDRAEDDRRHLRAEVERLRELIRAHVSDESESVDTWGALLREVGYDCE